MAAPTKLISASQPFQSPQGTAVALGFIRLTLSTVCEVISGGGQVTTQPLILALDSAGKLAATAIWFNDELTPASTVYHVELLGANGCLLINDFGFASVTGGSFDLATAVFSGAPSGPTFSGAVLLTPTGNQTITTGNLTLSNGGFTGGSSTNPNAFGNTTVTSVTAGFALTLSGTNCLSVDGAVVPLTAGLVDIGTAALPFSGIRIGAAATNNVRVTATATGARTATLPDNTGTIAELNLAQTWTAAQTFSANAFGLTLSKQVFTGNGTFTIPTGVTSAKVTLFGGGGAGGGATAVNGGAGGGSGGLAIKFLTGLTPANTIAVTVGGGGTGVSQATGNNGAASTIASGTQSITTVTANGGAGGNVGVVPAVGGAGATVSTNGDVNATGSAGVSYIVAPFGAPGASTMLGGSGSIAGASAAGNAAVANTGSGGGGAGAGANNAGGNGGSGLVIFEWVV